MEQGHSGVYSAVAVGNNRKIAGDAVYRKRLLDLADERNPPSGWKKSKVD